MELRELQLYKLNILRDIAQFCDENEIQYVLAWGTLLGAVRHGGFIPWDDDVDIAMPWDDYKRFIKLASRDLPSKYFVQNFHSDPKYPMMFTQIRVNETTSMPIKSAKLNMHWGICIDIFPLAGMWESERRLNIQKKLLSLCNSFLITDYMRTIDLAPLGAQKVINIIPRGIRRLFASILMEIACHGSNNKQSWFSIDAGNVSDHGKRNEWLERIKWNYEGVQFWIPKAYDSILTKAYGDYMVPPPPELQGGHELSLGDQIIDPNKSYIEYQRELQSKRSEV